MLFPRKNETEGGDLRMNKVIIIPDVHGRKFWRTAMSWADNTPIVFLGDYLDPYWDEGIDAEEAYEQLDEIINFKKTYPETVTLLLGNHDLHYLSSQIGGCRYDWRHAYQNKALLWSNLELFDIAHAIESNGRQFLFTHAGVLREWYKEHYNYTGEVTATDISSRLNEQFHNSISQSASMIALADISPKRGGTHVCGSPVWADVAEHNRSIAEFENIYQIFGHSLMLNEIITPYWACVDCREAFLLRLNTGKMKRMI